MEICNLFRWCYKYLVLFYFPGLRVYKGYMFCRLGGYCISDSFHALEMQWEWIWYPRYVLLCKNVQSSTEHGDWAFLITLSSVRPLPVFALKYKNLKTTSFHGPLHGFSYSFTFLYKYMYCSNWFAPLLNMSRSFRWVTIALQPSCLLIFPGKGPEMSSTGAVDEPVIIIFSSFELHFTMKHIQDYAFTVLLSKKGVLGKNVYMTIWHISANCWTKDSKPTTELFRQSSQSLFFNS